ncbi:hypothetical protein SK128_022955 [Halocaridina rubra]|uniref:Uncharacterized protein n=1 Tax=Halocaridina rubra TaxID=373956 RepID=A0AAN9A7K6_HALRR
MILESYKNIHVIFLYDTGGQQKHPGKLPFMIFESYAHMLISFMILDSYKNIHAKFPLWFLNQLARKKYNVITTQENLYKALEVSNNFQHALFCTVVHFGISKVNSVILALINIAGCACKAFAKGGLLLLF